MKKYLNGLMASAAMVGIAGYVGVAQAQDWTKDGDAQFRVSHAEAITSGTTVESLELMSPKNDLYITHKGSVIASATVNGKLADGTVVVSQTPRANVMWNT